VAAGGVIEIELEVGEGCVRKQEITVGVNPIGENCNAPHCKEKFDTFTEYMKRWNKIHISEINIYDCQLCKIRFRKALRAKKHVKSVHRNVTDIVITTVIVNKYSLIIRLIMKISAKHT
jgi:hypothetical protein